jgi:hypothetical protein
VRMHGKASELPFQCLARAALRLVINHVKDFDGTVRGTCCEALAVVIQLRVVLGKVTVSVMSSGCARWRVRSCPHVPFQWALRPRVPRNDEMWSLTLSAVNDD